MDEDKLIFSIPAEISIIPDNEFTFQENNNFVTPVKLKVFYKGTTPDGRTFTEDFSSKVIKSLPQTPVVAYYSEEDEDFVGHNDEQYVYGYVPEVGQISFEEIDGKTWAVTDIVLFTGRNDNIGKIAKKIIGKKHSLELDSKTTKYELKKDKFGKIKEMVFTDGSIIGLSVLGDNQTPGFTGSAFFTQQEQTIQELITKYMDIKQELHISNFIELINENKNYGGVEMNFSTETIAIFNNYMKETYSDENKIIFAAAMEKFGAYAHIIELSENVVIFRNYEDGKYYKSDFSSSEEGVSFAEQVETNIQFDVQEQNTQSSEEQLFIRTPYDEVERSVVKKFREAFGADVYIVQWSSIDNAVVYYDYNKGTYSRVGYVMNNETEELTFGNSVEVKPRFLTDEEIDKTFPEGMKYSSTAQVFSLNTTTDSSFTTTDAWIYDGTSTLPSTGFMQWDLRDTTWTIYNVPVFEEPKGKFVSEEELLQIEADKQELELYRKDKKESIVKKFAKFLSKEELENYMGSLEKYSLAELEKELSFASMQKLLNEQLEEENDNGQFKATKIIEANGGTVKSASDQVNDLIKRYK